MGGSVLVLLIVCLACILSVQESSSRFFICCVSPTDSQDDLAARFGPGNVIATSILGGSAEDEYNEGTVLFANDSDSRVEIFWKDVPRNVDLSGQLKSLNGAERQLKIWLRPTESRSKDQMRVAKQRLRIKSPKM